MSIGASVVTATPTTDRSSRREASPPKGRVPREEQLSLIFEEYYRPVYRFFLNRGFDHDECLDLAQETFFRVYKGMHDYREEARLKTWILTIAANLWRNEIRSRRAEKRSGEEISLDQALDEGRPVFGRSGAPGDAGPSALKGLLAEERLQCLRRAVDGLPPRMRQCVKLRLEQDLKYRDIAVILGVSTETVKAQLHQARQRLQVLLAEVAAGVEL